MNPDGFPDQSAPQILVSELLSEGVPAGGWHLPADQCSQVQSLLLRPREQQAEFVLALLVRLLWTMECRGQEAVKRFFLLKEVAALLLRRKLPFDQEQLTALVVLTACSRLAKELGALVVRQVGWQGRPSEPVRRALKRLKKAGEFGQSIEPLLSRRVQLPPTASKLDQRRYRALVGHARRLPDKVSKRWLRKGRALLGELGPESVALALLPWLAENLKKLHAEHPRLLRGLTVLLGELPADQVVESLEAIARWGYRRQQGKGPQAQALATSAIRSLGRISTSLALATLVALGSELRYPSAGEELLKALRKAARRQQTSLHRLVEVETSGWSPQSDMGKRLWRSHCRRLERCLRSGRSWPLQEWTETYENTPLLGAMGRALVWACGPRSFAWRDHGWYDLEGQPYQPDAPVRLWHPAEFPGEAWSCGGQPFKQVGRETFFEADFQPCVLKQFPFAAVARQRDWHYRLVGRFTAASEAVLELGRYRVVLEVERAQPRGPFNRDGLALQVRLTRLTGEPPLSELPARLRSEVVRDLHLFTSVASLAPQRDN